MIFLFVALIVSIVVSGGVVCYITHKHNEEKREIFNRFMAGDYRSYMYYKGENQVHIDDLKKRLEKDREKVKTEEQIEKEREAERF